MGANGALKYGIKQRLQGISLLEDEPMSSHTYFSIGGPADLMAVPNNADDMSALIRLCSQSGVPFIVIGNGSNMLVSDKGIRGLVIKTTGISGLNIYEDETLEVFCGESLSRVALFARDAGLAGLEFSFGIPGSVGGAVFMNAGAYGGQMSDVVFCSEYFDSEGRLHLLDGKAHDFSYRSSFFSKNPGFYHIKSILKLKKGDKAVISEKMQELKSKRINSQPLDLPSAGSVFKRPPGNFAGTLIEKAGLKGFKIGGAEVSQKHAGFIVNTGGATCSDVLRLIEHIQKTVYNLYGVSLQPEICVIGEK